jgi:2-iminobutanoate/2-iminopropanoate deaminase
MGQEILPKQLTEQGYALGYKVGNLLWVAGQVAMGDDGKVVGPGDPVAQTECIFRRIGLILADAGAAPKDVVMIRTFVTDMRYLPMVREVRARFFNGHKPASTTVQIAALAQPEYLIEIDVQAVIGQSQGATA